MELKLKKTLILLIALLTIGLGVLAFVYFAYPQLIGAQVRHQHNPLLGTWESEHAFYGKRERLVFTESGQMKSSSQVATEYKIDGNRVIVKSADKVVEYRVSKDGQSVDAYLPRAGRIRYHRVE